MFLGICRLFRSTAVFPKGRGKTPFHKHSHPAFTGSWQYSVPRNIPVILNRSIQKVGNKGDIVHVPRGYARYYLYAHDYARTATSEVDIVKLKYPDTHREWWEPTEYETLFKSRKYNNLFYYEPQKLSISKTKKINNSNEKEEISIKIVRPAFGDKLVWPVTASEAIDLLTRELGYVMMPEDIEKIIPSFPLYNAGTVLVKSSNKTIYQWTIIPDEVDIVRSQDTGPKYTLGNKVIV